MEFVASLSVRELDEAAKPNQTAIQPRRTQAIPFGRISSATVSCRVAD